MLSVIIPVWNDTASLSACLVRFDGPVMPPVEIIVADASSEKERRLIDRGCADGIARNERAVAGLTVTATRSGR